MNKAFVKEPEPAEPRCPLPAGCDGLGTPVTRKTLVAQLPEEDVQRFGDSVFYCPNPGCQVAYFDAWGVSVDRTQLRTLAYPKSPTAPVCSCFGLTAEEIQQEAEAGRKDRIREIITKAESADAQCQTISPSGASCATEIRRIFLKHFSPS